MKHLLCLLLCTIPFSSFSQEFELMLYFQDAEGNKDTLTLGYSELGSNDFILGQFGEVNIAGEDWNENFEVRLSNKWLRMIYDSSSSYYQAKRKILFHQCDSFNLSVIQIDIKAKNWPIYVDWDSSLFAADSCIAGTFISNIKPTLFPKGDGTIATLSSKRNMKIYNHFQDSSNVSYYTTGNDSVISYFVYVGNKKQTDIYTYIQEVERPQCLDKPGWNLIFWDNFEGTDLNLKKWHVSHSIYQHFWDNEKPGTPVERKANMNPANIVVAGGVVSIWATNAQYNGQDGYSVGEVSTFGETADWHGHLGSNPAWIGYGFLPDCYVEATVKIPVTRGLNAAGWLYNFENYEYSEIDFFEASEEATNQLSIGYIWGYNGQPQYNNGNIGENFRFYDLSAPIFPPSPPRPLCEPLEFDKKWITLGVSWGATEIKWYANDQIIKTSNMLGSPPKRTNESSYKPPIDPLALRLSTGPSIGSEKIDYFSLPSALTVDCVCAYQKEGSHALNFPVFEEAVCSLNSFSMACRYYPDVSYSWSCPVLSFQFPNPDEEWKTIATVVSGTSTQTPYSVTVTATFPSGYVEQISRTFYIVNDVPPTPNKTIWVEPHNNTCYYKLRTEKSSNYSYRWSLNGGASWKPGITVLENGVYYSDYYALLEPGSDITSVSVKAVNVCGTSLNVQEQDISVPNNPPHPNCYYKRNLSTSRDLKKTSALSHFTTYVIYDIMGRELVRFDQVDQEKLILPQTLKPGLYIIRYLDENNHILKSGKILKLVQ